MIVLGIDPGIATLGYGVIEEKNGEFDAIDYGVITTSKTNSTPQRLAIIWDKIQILIKHFNPDSIAVEELFFTKNVKTGIVVAEARGVILLAAAKSEAELYEYTPMQIKQAVCGYGGADKQQVQNMVKILLRLKAIPRPDDAADALAVAICHAQTNKMAILFKM